MKKFLLTENVNMSVVIQLELDMKIPLRMCTYLQTIIICIWHIKCVCIIVSVALTPLKHLPIQYIHIRAARYELKKVT